MQRAVRFVRSKASSFGIDASRIGALGSSSGGHLVSMLGTLDDQPDQSDADPINRLSAKVQAVVALYAPFNLAIQFQHSGGVPEALFIGAWLTAMTRTTSQEYKLYAAASPLTHVTRDDPPFLLFHGDSDATVSIEQSVAMEAALKRAGVDVQFIRVPGGRHGRNFGFAPNDPRLPNYLSDVVKWFDVKLKARK